MGVYVDYIRHDISVRREDFEKLREPLEALTSKLGWGGCVGPTMEDVLNNLLLEPHPYTYKFDDLVALQLLDGEHKEEGVQYYAGLLQACGPYLYRGEGEISYFTEGDITDATRYSYENGKVIKSRGEVVHNWTNPTEIELD